MVIVHVIPPSDCEGDRHEEQFPDGTSNQEILRVLTMEHKVGGQRVPPRQKGYGPLTKDGGRTLVQAKYLDHPETVVAVGKIVDGKFVEAERIQGPKERLFNLDAVSKPSAN